MDKRRKITPEQKEEIILKHSQGITAYKLAKEYGISAMNICYIVHPEKLVENRKKYREKNCN